jgi:hypothetical protein
MGDVSTVYDVIREHFGEDPSRKLAESLRGKKVPRIEELYGSYVNFTQNVAQDKPANTLRPHIYLPEANNGMIIGPRPPGLLSMRRYRHLLLYCHSLAFEDRFAHAIWRELTGSNAPLLVNISGVIGHYSSYYGDLIDDEVVVPLAFDPGERYTTRPSEEHEAPGESRFDRLCDIAERWHPLTREGFASFVFPSMDIASDLDRALTLTARYGKRSDLWVPEESHIKALRKFLRKEPRMRMPVANLRKIITIGRLEVPGINELTHEDIRSMRRDEEVFEDFRRALSAAIDGGVVAASTVSGNPINAFRERLMSSYDQLKAASASAKYKKIFTQGARDFTVGAVGAGAAAAIFGVSGLAASLTSGAVTAALGATPGVVRSFRSRKAAAVLTQSFVIMLRDAEGSRSNE